MFKKLFLFIVNNYEEKKLTYKRFYNNKGIYIVINVIILILLF
jgi:hypothetical protein